MRLMCVLMYDVSVHQQPLLATSESIASTATMVSPCEPRWVPVALEQDGAPVKSAHMKAWLYNSQSVAFWELRRFIDAAEVRPMSVRLHSWLRSRGDEFKEVFFRAQLHKDYVMRPSRKAVMEAQRRSTDESALEFVREEWSIKTSGLLALLCHLSTSSRLGIHRSKSAAVLRAWVAATCSPAVADIVAEENIPPHLAAHCDLVAKGGLCCHMCEAVLAQRLGSAPQHIVADALARMWRTAVLDGCEACGALYRHVVDRLEAHIWDNLPTIGSSSAMLSSQIADPSSERAKKRRRFDEDLKRCVVEKGSGRDGHATSARAFVRATGAASPSSAAYWVSQELIALQAGAWVTMSQGGAMHAALDGARIGNPAEDTELILAWSAASEKGCVCPPQARFAPAEFF